MKALRTQFDADEFAGVVATPTCCSCSCCSCCVASFVGASVVGAVTVAAVNATTNTRRASIWLGVLAVLIPPGAILGLAAFATYLAVDGWLALVTLLVLLVGGYTLLFSRLRGRPAVGLALGVTAAFGAAVFIELTVGVFLVATDAWFVYLLLAAAALGGLWWALSRPGTRDFLSRSVRGTVDQPDPPVPTDA